MNLGDILRNHLRPCTVSMDRTPFWKCDLPNGHSGPHVSIHANPWELDA